MIGVEMETELLGEYSLEEIKKGFAEEDECYTCLLCGAHFLKGEIYRFEGKFYEGSKAIALHIKQEHDSVQNFLLNIKANHMGISELQLQLLNFFANGLTDKEIAEHLGVSGSTIRNHRYKLRERERQNKLFLALMESLENDRRVHSKINFEGEVEVVSEKEKKRILEQYMTHSGTLKSYPRFETSRRIILEEILNHFNIGEPYREEEIKDILSGICEDYKFLKDELMAYDYLDRTEKGAIYWIRNYKSAK